MGCPDAILGSLDDYQDSAPKNGSLPAEAAFDNKTWAVCALVWQQAGVTLDVSVTHVHHLLYKEER